MWWNAEIRGYWKEGCLCFNQTVEGSMKHPVRTVVELEGCGRKQRSRWQYLLGEGAKNEEKRLRWVLSMFRIEALFI
jgi:hypothetical protein